MYPLFLFISLVIITWEVKIINRRIQPKGDLVNDSIPFNEVLVIADDGEKLGVLSLADALEKTSAKGLDLVVVNPNATPPVAKMMDYSKHRYDQQKRKREMKKNQKTIQVKEVRLSPVIEEHDLNTKFRQAKRFIESGDKVKITLRFRGRMITHSDQGFAVVNEFIERFRDTIKVDSKPKLEGRVINALIVPNTKKK